MRKLSFLLLSAAMLFSLVGCGKDVSATSDSSSSTTNEVVMESSKGETEVIETTEEENQQLNNGASEDETETQEPEETSSSPEASAPVDYEDYFEGNTWNLTAYAEALGYEWIPDPEYEGAVMYAIENNGIKYFFCFRGNAYYVFYGDQDGRCWRAAGDDTIDLEFKKYAISSDGQATEDTAMEMIERVATVMAYFRYDDTADGFNIPGHYLLNRLDGSVSYYANGMIRQRDFGEILESYVCNN